MVEMECTINYAAITFGGIGVLGFITSVCIVACIRFDFKHCQRLKRLLLGKQNYCVEHLDRQKIINTEEGISNNPGQNYRYVKYPTPKKSDDKPSEHVLEPENVITQQNKKRSPEDDKSMDKEEPQDANIYEVNDGEQAKNVVDDKDKNKSLQNTRQKEEISNVENEDKYINYTSSNPSSGGKEQFKLSTESNPEVDALIHKSASQHETITVSPGHRENEMQVADTNEYDNDVKGTINLRKDAYVNVSIGNESKGDSDQTGNRSSAYSTDSSTSSSSGSDNSQHGREKLQKINEDSSQSSCENGRKYHSGCKTLQSNGVTVHKAKHVTMVTNISKRVYYPNR